MSFQRLLTIHSVRVSTSQTKKATGTNQPVASYSLSNDAFLCRIEPLTSRDINSDFGQFAIDAQKMSFLNSQGTVKERDIIVYGSTTYVVKKIIDDTGRSTLSYKVAIIEERKI